MLRSRIPSIFLILAIGLSMAGLVPPAVVRGAPAVQAAAPSFAQVSPANIATDQPTRITLSWTALTGFTGETPVTYRYCVQPKTRCPGGQWKSAGTALSATVSGLRPATNYNWWVRAYDASGNLIVQAETSPWSFRTGALPGGFDKSAPTDHVEEVPIDGQMLAWTTSANATSYEYCLDYTNNDRCDTTWNNVGNALTTVVNNLTPNSVYYWQVRSVSGVGVVEADSSGVWWSFTTVIIPGYFVKLAPGVNGTGVQVANPILNWSYSQDAVSYEYCLEKTNTAPTPGTDCSADWISVGGNVTATLGTLPYASSYYWQVRAVADTERQANEGTWWKFTTQDPPPDNFSKIAPSNGATGQPIDSVTLSWQGSTGAQYYEYCVTPTQGVDCEFWFETNNTSVQILTLDPGTIYYWQVRAVNDTGMTPANDDTWWSFKTFQGNVIFLPLVMR